MPTVQQIEMTAARLRRDGKRVSLRNVRAELPRGGSYSDIGPVLAAWKAKAHYRPKPLPEEVPASMAPVIDEFAVRLWAAARDEAEKVVEQRMRAHAELERVFEQEATAAWTEIDLLMEEVRRLRGQLADADLKPRPMPSPGQPGVQRTPTESRPGPEFGASARIDGLKRTSLDHIARRRIFWDAVLDEVVRALEATEKKALPIEMIFAELPETIRRFPEGEPFTVADLKQKLKVWSHMRTRIREQADGSLALALAR